MRLDAVWQLARNDFALSTKAGAEDVFLWEHCDRVAKLSLSLTTIVSERKRPPDKFAVAASSLYHNAAWAALVREDGVCRSHILTRPLSPNQLELSVEAMNKALRGVLVKETLARAELAILSMDDRRHDCIEGMILADAEELEKFSLASIWSCVRKGLIEGRGLGSHVETWHRQVEYQYWTAKLSDGFFFEESITLARRRLESYQAFMETLEKQLHHQDLSIHDGAACEARASEVVRE